MTNSLGKLGNQCLVKKCQPQYILHDNKCISLNQSTSCLEPHGNPFRDEYNVADLFRPVLLVIIDHGLKRPIKNYPTYRIKETILKAAEPCSNVQQKVYHAILKEENQGRAKCYLIYSTPLPYQIISQMVESGKIERHLFPESRVLKMAAINHDPVVGLNCSRGSGSYVLTHKVQNNIHNMEVVKMIELSLLIEIHWLSLKTLELVKRLITYYFCQLRFNRDDCSLNN